jgi:homoserine kinase type II
MAAFTTFSDSALERYLIMFGIGELKSWSAIETGIENSNYFITTEKHGEDMEFVLTIMEDLTFEDVPFFNTILRHLSHFGLPVPAPHQTLDGMTSTIFCGKPTLVLPKLTGNHLIETSTRHCTAIGKALAEIHVTLASKNMNRDNPYNIDWMEKTIIDVQHLLEDSELRTVNRIANEYAEVSDLPLPRGIIHGDLFRDNALFEDDNLTGIIDFYHACTDFYIQDIAITINDWCRNENGSMDPVRTASLIEGYESVRTLEAEEREFLPFFQRAASARFALTRLLSGEEGAHLKDPKEFLKLAGSLS